MVAEKVSHFQILKKIVLNSINGLSMRLDLFVKLNKMIKHYNIIRLY